MTNFKTRLTISAFLLAVLCTAAVGKTIYVDENATGPNDGSSWADAYNYLQDALGDANSAEKPVEIWVAQGTYTPDSNSTVPNGTGEREATFQLINGVSIYGGFPSGDAEFGQRDPNLYETTLSGDLDGNDVSVSDPCDLLNEPNRAENSYHVVTGSRNNETALLDGFTISGGNADGSWVEGDYAGGGMYNSRSSPTLTGCTFSGNAAGGGGGMHNSLFSDPNLTNCTFSANSAILGGGMYNRSGSPILTNCTFSGNSAEYGGGMDNSLFSDPNLTNCEFSGNSAEYGGGMYNDLGIRPALTKCTFSANLAEDEGGGMYNESSSPILTNCTFSGNSAEYGGGMYNYDFCSPILTNCKFTGNSADRGGGMYNYDKCAPTLTGCTFSGNSASHGGGMDNNWLSNPTLTNCTFSGNSANHGGGMRNYDVSDPTLTGCTFSGNSAEDEGGGMYNYDRSDPTLTNCTFSGNSASHGGGMHSGFFSDPALTNCTFSGNSADRGGGMDNYDRSDPTLTGCILWGNTFPQVSGDATISYSNIRGAFPDEGYIYIDPFFVESGYWDPNGTANYPKDDFWVDGDYHLKSEAGRWDPNSKSWVLDDVNSPCIDAGDPNTCIGFEPNPNGRIVNMGAYGGTAEASLSPSGVSCISTDHQDYYEWVEVGAPACWCHLRQCHGDTDCKPQGRRKYWVSTNDLDVLIAAWNTPFAEIEGQTLYGLDLVCADFDHKAQGKQKYRVSTDDLDILVTNWQIADGPDPDCP
jgi:parallel beta-helix repeat protein